MNIFMIFTKSASLVRRGIQEATVGNWLYVILLSASDLGHKLHMDARKQESETYWLSSKITPALADARNGFSLESYLTATPPRRFVPTRTGSGESAIDSTMNSRFVHLKSSNLGLG
jgi:hypothetical protein